jgi:hypothetical protein
MEEIRSAAKRPELVVRETEEAQGVGLTNLAFYDAIEN